VKIVIVGATGQLGTDLMKVLQPQHEVIGLAHQDIEVSDYKSCLILEKHNPAIIINTAAFHKTDQCEEEPLKTFSVNAVGARNIAMISKEMKVASVFISTDYVFDGFKREPYSENDAPNPINTYGISKLAGELYTKQNPKHYIIRLASLFGIAGASGKGGNFVEAMVTKAKRNEPITVVNDIWMSPTYARDAALTIKKIIELELPFGIYHATNQGYCTWFQFASEIFKAMGLTITLKPIKASQLQAKARRPEFSALKSIKLPKYGIKIREWKEALYDYLSEKGTK